MTRLGEYVAEHGHEAVADELTRRLGKPITPHGVRMWASRSTVPKAWAEALGLEAESFSPPRDPSAAASPFEDSSEGRQHEQPPKAPPGAGFVAPPVPPTPFRDVARRNIAATYNFVGAGLATAVDAPGFEANRGVGGGIGAVWSHGSDPVAAAWIAWADEGNKFAQSVVRLMSAGGAGAEVVMCHLALLGGTAYVMGNLPDNEATRIPFGKYRRYRAEADAQARAAAERAAEPHGEPSANGAAGAGAEDLLGGAVPPARD